jgi:hypothetical protein
LGKGKLGEGRKLRGGRRGFPFLAVSGLFQDILFDFAHMKVFLLWFVVEVVLGSFQVCL